jgi:hypothetical protein
MDTLNKRWRWNLGGGPDRNSGWNGNGEQRSGSRVDGFDCEANAKVVLDWGVCEE